jgi:HEAT repeat protein
VRQLCAEALLEKGDFRALRTLAALLTEPEKQQRVLGGLALRDLSGTGAIVVPPTGP